MNFLVVFVEGVSTEVLVALKFYKDSIEGREAAQLLASTNNGIVIQVTGALIEV